MKRVCYCCRFHADQKHIVGDTSSLLPPPFLWIPIDNAGAGTGNDIPKDPWAILELPAKLVDKWRAKVTPLSRCTLQFQVFQVQMAFCNSIVYPDEIVRYKTSLICSISTYYELFNEPWLSQQKWREKNQLQSPNSVRIIVLHSLPSNNW
jgi:hypothetical protein